MASSYETGKALSERMNPGMEAVLEERYGDLVPGLAQSVVDFAYGQQYARPGLGMRERVIATIAAVAALGAQTGPQLRIHIKAGLSEGLTPQEIGEIIWQMALYGGFPAAISALNVLRDVLAEQETTD